MGNDAKTEGNVSVLLIAIHIIITLCHSLSAYAIQTRCVCYFNIIIGCYSKKAATIKGNYVALWTGSTKSKVDAHFISGWHCSYPHWVVFANINPLIIYHYHPPCRTRCWNRLCIANSIWICSNGLRGHANNCLSSRWLEPWLLVCKCIFGRTYLEELV